MIDRFLPSNTVPQNWKFQQKKQKMASYNSAFEIKVFRGPEISNWKYFFTLFTVVAKLKAEIGTQAWPRAKGINNMFSKSIWDLTTVFSQQLPNWMHFTSHFLALFLLIDQKHLLD